MVGFSQVRSIHIYFEHVVVHNLLISIFQKAMQILENNDCSGIFLPATNCFRFFPNCGSSDGEWYVCMDNIYQDVQRNKCLVYSFGISDDLTFEEEMAGIGCNVHA